MARDRLAAMRAAQQGQGGGAYSSAPSAPAPHSSYGGTYGQQRPYGGESPRAGGRGNTGANENYEMQQSPGQAVFSQQDDFHDMDSFMNEVSRLRDCLSEINSNVDKIKDLHGRAASQLDEGLHAALTEQIQATASETKSMNDFLKSRLHNLDQSNSRILPGPEFDARKRQVAALRKRFMDTIQRYQDVERESRHKLRDRMERQYKIVKPDATPEEIRQAIESDDQGQYFSQALMSSNRSGDARAAYREAQERHRDVRKIEQTIMELAQIFNDLALMTRQQEEVIRDVETTAVQAADHIQDAEAQLKVARKSAAGARRKRWICFWVILAIIVVAGGVAAILIVTKKK